jgi:DNA-binding transcriptional MerR regulator
MFSEEMIERVEKIEGMKERKMNLSEIKKSVK